MKPSLASSRVQIVIPERKTLRELRRTLARGGLPPIDKRTAEDSARIVAYRAVGELCRLLDEYQRRIESGERIRLVEQEQRPEVGRMHLDFVIEVVP